MLNRFLCPWIVICAALSTVSCSRDTAAASAAAVPAVPVRALIAQASEVPLEITAIGNVEAISSVDVKARTTAPIVRVNFADGQDVSQGQLLFELDPESLSRQIAELEANIARDVANEKQAEANVARDLATLKNLDSMATRGTQLQKEGVVSREQADQLTANAEAAKSSVEADRAALDSGKAAEKADRARLQQTHLQLDYTKVYAPIAGRAGAIAMKQGNLAKENDNTLVTILQTTPIYVSFSVPENLLPEIRQYNAAKTLAITAQSGDGQTSTGTLQFIDNSVDSTTGTIKLKASFPNAGRVLWPGQFVNVRARLSTERDRILISSQTVQTGPQGKYVWVINPADSTVSMRNVTVLRIVNLTGQGEKAVIGTGLNSGENVVSEGQMRLAPNAKVRLLQPNAVPAS